MNIKEIELCKSWDESPNLLKEIPSSIFNMWIVFQNFKKSQDKINEFLDFIKSSNYIKIEKIKKDSNGKISFIDLYINNLKINLKFKSSKSGVKNFQGTNVDLIFIEN